MRIIRLSSWIFSIGLLFTACQTGVEEEEIKTPQYLMILGIAQDAGFPHINNPDEWKALQNGESDKELVTSIGLVDNNAKKKYLIEATPDMPEQLHNLEFNSFKNNRLVDGVFLTHAHIGHYTGLMYFGREAMGADNIPVYAMPKMQDFLINNGPWSQLVKLNNIKITPLEADKKTYLTEAFQIIPILVPHRDEFSETVGYKIIGPEKTALFIPDINKWQLWNKNIIEEVKKVDYALLDATFFKEGEIPRDMAEVPHPFIEETTALFEEEAGTLKSKIIFIHFNHSNPALLRNQKDRKLLEKEGYRFAKTGMILPM